MTRPLTRNFLPRRAMVRRMIAPLICAGIEICGVTFDPPPTTSPRPNFPPPQSMPTTAPSRPRQTLTVGSVKYAGNHSWRGVVDVQSDNLIYADGDISAPSSGIPQGITFVGNRANLTFRNLKFAGVGDGVIVENNQSIDDVTIENCQFNDCHTPAVKSDDKLLSSRGYGMFVSAGHNWTIRDSSFQTRCLTSAEKPGSIGGTQYAMRLGDVRGLQISNSRFENFGKACVWLMFVHDAVIDGCTFTGGPIRIGVRPGDMPGVKNGDCSNIVFRNCTFKFSSYEDWPAGIVVYPGSNNIRFENCTVTTVPGSDWWLEVDSRMTSNVQWKNCRWNGKTVDGYTGIRSSMPTDEMKAKNVTPAADEKS